jgi:tRNA threonylcarbamoyladenosine biosynthesis protein TsaE
MLYYRQERTGMLRLIYHSKSPAGTFQLGKRIGKWLAGGSVIALIGELGSGKTLLTRGICAGMGLSTRYVNSPTFVFVNEYRGGPLTVYHMDLYRLENIEEGFGIGILDYLTKGEAGVIIVEWAEKILSLLPEDYLKIEFTVLSEKERNLALSSTGDKYDHLREAA